ncbi:hypothetical protein ES708_33904 [subsurface metagenome]
MPEVLDAGDELGDGSASFGPGEGAAFLMNEGSPFSAVPEVAVSRSDAYAVKGDI